MASKETNCIFRFSYFIFLIIGTCYSQSTDKLLQGRQVKELVSASGRFRLGFFNSPSTTNYYLAISYIKPDQLGDDERDKPVWIANRNVPIFDPSGSLTIDSDDGNLKILHSNGGDSIAVSSIPGVSNTSATLQDSGNLVLQEINPDGSERRVLWQSFDYPTDTLLPGMILGMNLETGKRWFLQSWITKESPAEGSFTIGVDPNKTNQLSIWWRGEIHSNIGLWQNGKFDSSGSWDDEISAFVFSYTSNKQEKYFSYSVKGNITSFPILRIMADGGLATPNVTGRLIEGYPICGNVSFQDFKTRTGSKSNDGFSFKESDNMTIDDCQLTCLKNCSCIAFASTNENNKTGCQIWIEGTKFTEFSNPVFNVRFIYIREAISTGDSGNKGSFEKGKKGWSRNTLKAVIATPPAVLLFLCMYYLTRRKYKAKVEKRNQERILRELGDNLSLPTTQQKGTTQEKGRSMSHDLKIIDFQIIVAAANNFSLVNKLGEGGFGPVYKGKLADGQEVGIKRLSKTSGQGMVEFKNEAKLIAKLQHNNLVRLLGCCLQGEEKILVYEYMPNKSLDFFIFDSGKRKQLNWRKRYNIIEGIAQGLIYLHKYSRLRVIHRDLKASNILLDDQMNPKISDFGLARIFGVNELEVNTNRVVGTYGYMSPEYAISGIVSMKTDVFSFGVLVLEIVSGKKNNSCYHSERPLNLVGYAWQLWSEGKGLELIDAALDQSYTSNEVLRCIHVGLLCVQDQPTDRPTMSDVVSMLTNETMALSAPKQPAFFISVNSDKELEVIDSKSKNCSVNEVTISELEAR